MAKMDPAPIAYFGGKYIPIEEARKIVGTMKIGLSTHSILQVKEALKHKPDYIGFGPIYQTNAKLKPDKPLGTEQLKQVLAFADIPVVAIGGIFPENITSILEAGAKNICMLRYFMQTNEFDQRIKIIQNLLTS